MKVAVIMCLSIFFLGSVLGQCSDDSICELISDENCYREDIMRGCPIMCNAPCPTDISTTTAIDPPTSQRFSSVSPTSMPVTSTPTAAITVEPSRTLPSTPRSSVSSFTSSSEPVTTILSSMSPTQMPSSSSPTQAPIESTSLSPTEVPTVAPSGTPGCLAGDEVRQRMLQPNCTTDCYPPPFWGTYLYIERCSHCPDNTFQSENNSWNPCRNHSRDCTPGEYTYTLATPTTDRLCATCSPTSQFSNATNADQCMYYSRCSPGSYERIAPTTTSDRICSPCELNVTYQDAHFAETCKPVTMQCPLDAVEYAPPTLTSDRVCRSQQCDPGWFWLGSDCHICPPFTWNSNPWAEGCTPCTECVTNQTLVSPCNATTDSICDSIVTSSGTTPISSTLSSTSTSNALPSVAPTQDVTSRSTTPSIPVCEGSLVPLYNAESGETQCGSCRPGEFVNHFNGGLSSNVEIFVCSDCPIGTYTNESSHVNFRCTPKRNCASRQYDTHPGSLTMDRQCAQCGACSEGQFVLQNCNVSSNTICGDCQTACSNGMYRVGSCSSTSTPICRNCKACLANQRVVSACTSTRDTVCGTVINDTSIIDINEQGTDDLLSGLNVITIILIAATILSCSCLILLYCWCRRRKSKRLRAPPETKLDVPNRIFDLDFPTNGFSTPRKSYRTSRSRLTPQMKKILTSPNKTAPEFEDGILLLDDQGDDEIINTSCIDIGSRTPNSKLSPSKIKSHRQSTHCDKFGFGLPPMEEALPTTLNFSNDDTIGSPESTTSPNTKMLEIASRAKVLRPSGKMFVELFNTPPTHASESVVDIEISSHYKVDSSSGKTQIRRSSVSGESENVFLPQSPFPNTKARDGDCEDCGKINSVGAIDPEDDKFYCLECWENYDKSICMSPSSARESWSAMTMDKLKCRTQTQDIAKTLDPMESTLENSTETVNRQMVRNGIHASYLARLSNAPVLPGFKKVNSFTKVDHINTLPDATPVLPTINCPDDQLSPTKIAPQNRVELIPTIWAPASPSNPNMATSHKSSIVADSVAAGMRHV